MNNQQSLFPTHKMVKKQKICLVIPSLQAGGMERVMSELAWYFSKKTELEVHLVLYGLSRELFYPIPENTTVHKPRFVFNNTLRLLSTIRTLFFLRSKVKEIHPSTVLSFGEFWNSFVLLALYGLQYPVFVSDRSQPDKPLGRFHEFLRRKLYPSARGVIAQTKKAREIYQSIYHNKNFAVIGNPIRQIAVDSIVRENKVLMVGRLIHTKHQDRLIKIFIDTYSPDWKLVLVGYDHLKQLNSARLLNLIQENKAHDRVVLAGKQEDVDRHYRESKIFAFTSSSEGFPNAIGEALSAGLPVVAYDCVAGPAEMIIDGENGFLVPVFDDAKFKQKLQLLIDNETLRQNMAKKAVESMKKFSIEKIGEQYLDFILPK